MLLYYEDEKDRLRSNGVNRRKKLIFDSREHNILPSFDKIKVGEIMDYGR